jgi:molybdopterin-guanine dinucleotide biosynthesis protein A
MERRVSRPLAGVFVGGAGSRMGGAAKGLLRAPEGVTLVDRWRAILADAGADVVLVGSAEAYAATGLEAIADDPPGVGPVGGLCALLRRAGPCPALALGCDMPFVSARLVDRLVNAPPSLALAPRKDGRWEPLFARYDAAAVLPVALDAVARGRRALQAVLDAVGAVALPLSREEERELRDWDTPEDVARDVSQR